MRQLREYQHLTDLLMEQPSVLNVVDSYPIEAQAVFQGANKKGMSEAKRALPGRRIGWTSSKKGSYNGQCSGEIARCGRSQERSSDQKASMVLT